MKMPINWSYFISSYQLNIFLISKFQTKPKIIFMNYTQIYIRVIPASHVFFKYLKNKLPLPFLKIKVDRKPML